MAMTQDQFRKLMGLNKPEPLTGAVATGLNYLKQPLDQYALDSRVPLVGGMTAADFTGITGTQGLVQDFSRGKNIEGDMRMFDALGLVPAIAPAMKLTGKATSALGREALRQIDAGTGVGRYALDPRMYMINTPKGRIPTNYNDTKKLSEMLERAATQKGYNVTVDSSRVSPSTYVTLSKQIDDAPEYQVRLSNHQDKYQSQSPVGLDQTRFSVDPSPMSHGTFEEAVMFLENKGFPTKLSKKYKNQQDKIIKEQELIKQQQQKIVPTYKDINVTRSDSGKTFFVKGLLGEKISVDKNAIPLELRQSQDKTALNEFLRNKLFD